MESSVLASAAYPKVNQNYKMESSVLAKNSESCAAAIAGAPLGQGHLWDRAITGTGASLGQGHRHRWDRAIAGTGASASMGLGHRWDRGITGTGPSLGQGHRWDVIGTGYR